MDIQSRLKQFLQVKGLTPKEFEVRAGLANASASRINENSRTSTFDRIATAFPDLNIEWLTNGEGDMLKPANQSAGNVSGHNICGVNINGREIHITCPDEYETLLAIVNENKAATEKYQAMAEKYQAQLDKAQQQIDELIALLKAKL